jgi:hypothetical protein
MHVENGKRYSHVQIKKLRKSKTPSEIRVMCNLSQPPLHMISIEKKIATSFTMICEPDLDLIAESKECFGDVEGGRGHARHDPNVSCAPFIDK